MLYMHIGNNEVAIGDRPKLTRFGESVDLPEELYREMIIGGGAVQGWSGAVALLPEVDFKALAFTPKELQDFAYPSFQRANSPEADDFREKRKLAFMKLEENRIEVAHG